MKQFHCHLMFFVLFCGFASVQAQTFTLSPEKPTPNEKVMFSYDPTGGVLEGGTIEAVAYLFSEGEDIPVAVEVGLKQKGSVYSGTVATAKNTLAVLFSLKNEEGKADNNDETGYKTLMYQNDRETPVQGALGAKANIYASFGSFAGMKRNHEKALNLWKQEFKTHPSSQDNQKYYTAYANAAKRQKDEAVMKEMLMKADEIATAKKVTEDDLNFANSLYSFLGEEDKAEMIKTRAIKKFPEGLVARDKMFQEFRTEKDVDKKVALFEAFKKKFAKVKDIEISVSNMAYNLTSAYAENGDWDNFEKYLGMVTNKSMQASALNSAAWAMSGESIEGESQDVPRGLRFSEKSLQLVNTISASAEGKPVYETGKEWKKDMENTYAMYADTYALLAFKAGKADDALKYQQIACDNSKFKNGEMNERYCAYLEQVKGSVEAEKLLAKMMAEGNATSKMKEQHKRLFLANNTVESAYDKYVVSLEKEALANLKEELKKKMLDEKAPDFKLVNLKGEQVSLESLRGKVVVIDFWATWCGPCKASFPGMQKAVNKYEKSDDVAFVFIDTWESGEPDAKKENAKKFIESKSYTFNVLFDLDDKVVASFGVSGIPTKFVVDKKGMIRFKSVGFGGNDDELVSELSLMIEMAGGQSATGLTGAP